MEAEALYIWAAVVIAIPTEPRAQGSSGTIFVEYILNVHSAHMQTDLKKKTQCKLHTKQSFEIVP
jgi:hypothetical protein